LAITKKGTKNTKYSFSTIFGVFRVGLEGGGLVPRAVEQRTFEL
jgi:hypothetical protein